MWAPPRWRLEEGDVHGLAEQAFNPMKCRLLARVNERDGAAFAHGAACSADAVDVVVRIPGHGHVDDQVQLGDINAAAGHIGGHENAKLAGLELLHGIDPAVLALVRV